MGKTIAWHAYSMYLRDKGYSEESKSGNPSTTYDYPNRVDRIRKSDGSNLKALKLFLEFYRSFDTGDKK